MTFDNLLAALKKRNITLVLKDGQIAVPKGMLTAPLRRAIIAHKPELIRHLQVEQPPDHQVASGDDGYGEKYWTGKDCVKEGCTEPAGTGWGPLWCKPHDIERRNRVTAQMENLLTQFGDPAAPPTATERKIPGSIRLQYAIDWFKSATLKIPMADRGRQKARLAPPSRCRWLLDWLPKANRIEFEKKGDLPWVDWNAVMGEVRGKFETGLLTTSDESLVEKMQHIAHKRAQS